MDQGAGQQSLALPFSVVSSIPGRETSLRSAG
uniref:Uncharacterized protein n=1 Tax=Rhodococcus hoagii TaxID=43767 RepID=A0A1Z1UX74_RHOHA|nr:hypothetical protein pVAPN1572_0391 [Prescottella equi]